MGIERGGGKGKGYGEVPLKTPGESSWKKGETVKWDVGRGGGRIHGFST